MVVVMKEPVLPLWCLQVVRLGRASCSVFIQPGIQEEINPD